MRSAHRTHLIFRTAETPGGTTDLKRSRVTLGVARKIMIHTTGGGMATALSTGIR